MGRKRVLIVGYCVSHVVGSKIELLNALGYDPHVLEIGGYSQGKDVYSPKSFRLAPVTEPPNTGHFSSTA